jgi:tritrans,polycis-undecaprenyl-diphosphate synthase [geranylgeranyl-diphosphate specific]
MLDYIYKSYEKLLTQEIKNLPVPEHIAIIMDGNRRFAQHIGKHSYYGHRKGSDITEKVIEWSCEIGVKELTIYAFSTENFNRPKHETEKLFELISLKFNEITDDERTHERRMKIRAIGDIERLPLHLQESIEKAETATCNYENFKLNVALAYGGRQDIVQAVQEMARKISNGYLELDDINESTISEYLYPACGPSVSNVDLIIRTGGNERISNFLPWQANGNECATYFCAPFWPLFRKTDFLRSIRLYQSRLTKKNKHMFIHKTMHFLRFLITSTKSKIQYP